MHNNIVYKMLAEPIAQHLVGRVGGERKGCFNVWVDCTFAKKGTRLASHPAWIADVEHPELKKVWRMLKSGHAPPDVTLETFWSWGHIGMTSAPGR